MLVMKADVVSQNVEGPVIRVCLWRGERIHGTRGLGLRCRRLGFQFGERFGAVAFYFREEVVLCDEVSCTGVERAGEEGAHDEVVERLQRACCSDEDIVEAQLEHQVEEVDHGEWRAVDEHGTQGVEQDLEGAEEGLS